VVARFLITTADERTWKLDRPVLFLNERCRLYDRKSVWEGMDAEVAEPFALETDKKFKEISYVQTLTSELLIELAAALNSLHDTNHSPRYWNILLGHWLGRHVNVCFNRYFTIEQALKNYKITSTTIFDSTGYSLATSDSTDFLWACNDDIWNNVLYGRVLEHMGCKDVELDLVHLKNKENFFKQDKSISNIQQIIKPIGRKIKAFGINIFGRLAKDSDAFIIKSYLPKWDEIKLQLALWQCPQFWQSPPLKTVKRDTEMRRKFIVNSTNYKGFEKFVRDLLPELIPTCYLEGYVELGKQVETLEWPSHPKFIFTSNNFDFDEIFKAWVGLKVEQGVPYFTGAHGNYQADPYASNQPELVSCDNFFCWGSANGNIKNISAFVFKIANKPRKTKLDGGLLLIEDNLTHQIALNDIYSKFSVYQEQQFQFVEALPEKIKQELTVRLHGAWRSMGWSDDKRWSDRMPAVHLETGEAPIQKLCAKSRLVVHSYDSTGILETLASNTPTLCFWDGGLDHLLPRDKPYYELLRGAGILADSPEQAALFVTQYWDDIDGWWKSEQVQSARREFCEQYARNEKNPVRTMKRLLETAVLSHNN
jgi:putative transferase (TIGR04331 family)